MTTETSPVPAPCGPCASTRGGAWRRLRGGIVLSAAWVFLGLSLTLAALVALLTFRLGAPAYLHVMSRFCSRIVLRIAGIRLRVINPERIQGRRMRIIALNHTSQLDIFIFAALLPPYGTAIAKREIYFVPFLGWVFFAFKIPTVNRSNLEKAKVSMSRAARRLRERQATLVMAPEGSRTRDGRLGLFKMGLFHLAAETRAPIIPAIVRGAKECQPVGTFIPCPGVVEVEFLRELPTDDFCTENLHRKRDELRALFLRELGETESSRT